MTHDVFAQVIAGLGGHLRRVEITDLTDNTFHARLMLDQAGHEQAIDIRPYGCRGSRGAD
jgi:bifunctional DNase/RNase